MIENALNFTKAHLDHLPLPPPGRRMTYRDSKTHGLQLRVTSNGAKTFCVFRWVKADSKPERITLGRYPDLSIEKAREKAAAINAQIASGANPNDVVRAGRMEMTLAELFDLYLERWAKPHKKTWKDDVAQFDLFCKRRSSIATHKLSRIGRKPIATLHAEIGGKTPIQANRVLALISSIFGWAMEQGIWDKPNPAQGIRKFPEKTRDRFIQSEELPLFFEGLAMEPSGLLQDYFMLLLLTGARRSNLMAMRWDAISFERKEWRIPETKNGTPQIISLDDAQGVMMRILETRKSQGNRGPWVFPSNSATGHLAEPRKGWERILARAELFQLIGLIAARDGWSATKVQEAKVDANQRLEKALAEYRIKAQAMGIEIGSVGLRDLRIHDLRRTLGSWMAGTGASAVIIGRQLNHKSPSATAIYSRLQQDPVKEARNKAVTAIFGAGGVTQGMETQAGRK
jgi:integrase